MEQEKITIRKMNIEDIPAVFEIEQSIFSIPWSEKSFKDSLESENTNFVVALCNDEIVGYIGMYVFGEEADISNVAVSLKHRRKHIAQNMLDYILDWSQNKKIKNLTLEVRETNVPAIKLYEKNGFKEAGIRKDYYEKPKENAVIMWKQNL